MPGFGPFDSYSDALMAACPLILSKPNATAGRIDSQDFQLRWRISSEYCAWLYYTPDDKYEMSLLTDQSRPTNGTMKTCVLPPFVDDPRYSPSDIKYIFSLHNHPYADRLSPNDIQSIISYGNLHGFEVETRSRKVHLAVVAFFSNSNDFEHPTCDGFFEYIPLTGELLKWAPVHGQWKPKQIGTVDWIDATNYEIHWE